MVTINEITPSAGDIENKAYSYQTNLTTKLDGLDTDFDQATINEIVLWKVNRYAAIDNETLNCLNPLLAGQFF